MNILYIDIDSLRSDRLGCYGYHRSTSPNIDGIARDGLVCERVYTSDAPCLPSRTGFYSGRFGIQTGVVGHCGTAAEPKIEKGRQFQDVFDRFGLARLLQKKGFRTTMISPFGQRHSAHHFYAGFNEMLNTGDCGFEPADKIMACVNPWLATNVTKGPWYLHINFWDPHTPYRAPQSYGEPFANDPIPAWLQDESVLKRHLKKAGPHSAWDINMFNGKEDAEYPRQPREVTDAKGMRRLIDGYDTGVRYADDAVGEIVAALKKAGVYEDTAIIISADHGENLGELGIYAEHATADEGTCHIPMVIKFPGGVKGKRDQALHYHLDLAPTLAELLGVPAPELWDGQSFAPTVTTGAAQGREDLIIGQCAHVCQRAVRWENWLYIRTYHDGFQLFPEEMLFDLSADIHEQNDLAASKPEVCREAVYRLNRWHDAQMRKMAENASDVVDPLWTVIREGGPAHAGFAGNDPGGVVGFERYMKRLEETGREEGAKALRTKYAKELARLAKR